MLGSNNEFPKIIITESTGVTTPSAGTQKLYIESTGHTLQRMTSSGVAKSIDGDVTGPSGAVNLRVAVYDTTSGKLIKDGGYTIAEIISTAAGSAAAGGSSGEVQYNNGGALGGIATSSGSSGQVLTSNGAGQVPSYQSVSGGMTKIEEQTSTGSVVTFSSLGSFTHLKMYYNARSTIANTVDTVDLRFNGDTGTNYDRQEIRAAAGAASAAEALGQNVAAILAISGNTALAGACGAGEITVYDYRGGFHKRGYSVFSWQQSTASGNTLLRSDGFGWRSTAAITSISLTVTGGNYTTDSKISLYGMA